VAVYSSELGLQPNRSERELFLWLLASLLLGKPIQQAVAKRGWEALMAHGVDNPEALLDAGWRGLVEILDEGHYVRYDESTADYLLDTARLLIARYGGSVDNVLASASDSAEARKRLLQFKGIGPVTVRIFLRDVDQASHLAKGTDGWPVTLSREDLEGETLRQLRERAALLRIYQATKMSKEELVQALIPYYAHE
jgi:endonuclease III